MWSNKIGCYSTEAATLYYINRDLTAKRYFKPTNYVKICCSTYTTNMWTKLTSYFNTLTKIWIYLFLQQRLPCAHLLKFVSSVFFSSTQITVYIYDILGGTFTFTYPFGNWTTLGAFPFLSWVNQFLNSNTFTSFSKSEKRKHKGKLLASFIVLYNNIKLWSWTWQPHCLGIHTWYPPNHRFRWMKIQVKKNVL